MIQETDLMETHTEPQEEIKQQHANPMMANHQSNSVSCEEQIKKVLKKSRQDCIGEKERAHRVDVEMCQKEKQQLTNQLSQKYTLDLSYFKQDMIQQYREERDISDRKLQHQAHMEREDIRKELLLKYRKEVEDVKIEYEKKYFIQLQALKEEILHNITLENGDNETEKAFTYFQKDGLLQHNVVDVEMLRKEIEFLQNRTCPELLPASTVSSSTFPSTPALLPNEIRITQDQMVKIGFYSLGIFFLFFFGWMLSVRKEKQSQEESDSFELPRDQPLHVIETSSSTPQKSGPALISPTSPRPPGNHPAFPTPVQPIEEPVSTTICPIRAYDIYFSFSNSSSIPFSYYQRIAQELESNFGFTVFCPENKQEALRKDQILDLLDQTKCVLFFVTPEYQVAINDPEQAVIDGSLTRIEFNYSLGCLSATKMIPVITSELMVKKQSWKGRLRHDFYQSKSVSFFPSQIDSEKDFQQKIQELVTRIKAAI